ncbi:Cytochrome P450 [Macleaya cordata]|uniref:Cytochrome P450 n=1 Tax=Macleaya cordata TaxID=56857 RepID=A0A200Q3H8_MACCD|nr:Cytochrome P450 [Macleaya cordata]
MSSSSSSSSSSSLNNTAMLLFLAFAGLPVLGNLHMLGVLPHQNLDRLAKKYGPIMSLRLGLVPAVVVSSPEMAELFLKTHDINFASRPKVQASEYISYGTKGMAFTPYGSYWRNIRKLCTVHLLSNSKIESFKSMRGEEVRIVVDSIRVAAESVETVDLTEKVGSLVEDLTYRMVLGVKDDKFNLKPVIQECLRIAGAFNLADYVPYIGALDLQVWLIFSYLLLCYYCNYYTALMEY